MQADARIDADKAQQLNPVQESKALRTPRLRPACESLGRRIFHVEDCSNSLKAARKLFAPTKLLQMVHAVLHALHSRFRCATLH
jgi:hypothetical protein